MDKSKKVARNREWFFCWIERFIKGKNSGKDVKEYLFLTSSLAFGDSHDAYGCRISERESSLLKDFYSNKMLGYDAIRKLFGLKKDEGVEKRCQIFWETKSFRESDGREIKEITDKTKDFYHHFGRFVEKGYFLNEQLAHIVKFAPEELKNIAWKQLVSQNTSTIGRESFLRLLGDLLEFWFAKRNDKRGIDKTGKIGKVEELWKNTIAEKALDIRLDQVRGIYNYIYNCTNHTVFSEKAYLIRSSSWDFDMLESLVKRDEKKIDSKSKLEMMINYYKGHSRVKSLDHGIAFVRDMWDLFIIEMIFDECHPSSKNSKLIRNFFSTVGSMFKQ